MGDSIRDLGAIHSDRGSTGRSILKIKQFVIHLSKLDDIVTSKNGTRGNQKPPSHQRTWREGGGDLARNSIFRSGRFQENVKLGRLIHT